MLFVASITTDKSEAESSLLVKLFSWLLVST
jgi:hypothetical protein